MGILLDEWALFLSGDELSVKGRMVPAKLE